MPIEPEDPSPQWDPLPRRDDNGEVSHRLIERRETLLTALHANVESLLSVYEELIRLYRGAPVGTAKAMTLVPVLRALRDQMKAMPEPNPEGSYGPVAYVVPCKNRPEQHMLIIHDALVRTSVDAKSFMRLSEIAQKVNEGWAKGRWRQSSLGKKSKALDDLDEDDFI